MTRDQIRDYLRVTLDENVEGCGFVLEDETGPYILGEENLAKVSGMALSNHALFAMPPFEMWNRVRNQGHRLLAVLHNHPRGCAARPSQTDIVQGSPYTWYEQNGEIHKIPWIIINEHDFHIWDMNPEALTVNEVKANHPTPIELEELEWLQ